MTSTVNGTSTLGIGHLRNSHSRTGEAMMNHRYERTYQIWLNQRPPFSVVGGSSRGMNHSTVRHECSMPPHSDMSVTANTPRTQNGTMMRRIRRPIDFTPERSSEAAMREPPSANISPMAGKTTVSHANPSVWYVT